MTESEKYSPQKRIKRIFRVYKNTNSNTPLSLKGFAKYVAAMNNENSKPAIDWLKNKRS